jgi:OmpA-OmpF porin, OOP family
MISIRAIFYAGAHVMRVFNSNTSARALVAAGLVLVARAGFSAELSEPKRAKDHPALQRFSGSTLIAQGEVPFQKITVALGPLVMTPVGPNETAPRPRRAKSIEGRIYRHLYVAPVGTSVLEVHRNYEAALQKSGYTVEFECVANDCGVAAHGRDYNRDESLDANERRWVSFDVFRATYLAARRTAAGATTWVLIMVDEYQHAAHAAYGRPAILQILIEERGAQLGQVQINAAEIAREIGQSGKAALYGLYFDTNSDVLKADSRPQLLELSKYLTTNSAVQILIVGHTDNVGALDYNVQLSQRRAASVARELVNNFQISASRLTARGVGMLAPVSTNTSESGRALNRRVEVVMR